MYNNNHIKFSNNFLKYRIMRKLIFFICATIILFGCDKKKITKTKTAKDEMIDFCKIDIFTKSATPSTIKYDTLLCDVRLMDKKEKYYNKLLDETQDFIQINDSVSKKWRVSIYYDSENKYGAMVRNNVNYVIKENEDYFIDSTYVQKYVILSRMDLNKSHEYFGIE